MRRGKRFLAFVLAISMLLTSNAASVLASQMGENSEAEIVKQDINNTEILAGKKMTVLYTPEGQKPLPKVGCERQRLIEGQDFEAVYYLLNQDGTRIGDGLETVTDAGNYELVLQGCNLFEGTFHNAALVTVKPRSLTDGDIRIENTYAGYESGNVSAKYELWYQDVLLQENVDYWVTFAGISEDGNLVTFVFEGKGNYAGKFERQISLSSSDVVWLSETYRIADVAAQRYTGEALTPEVLLERKDGTSVSLVAGTDYTISYKNNISAGTAQVIVTGLGEYAGSLTEDFKILPIDVGTVIEKEGTKVTIGDVCVELQKNEFTYAGQMCVPEVVVTIKDAVQKAGVAYDIVSQDLEGNTAISKENGDYYVVVALQGNYTGQIKVKYTILPVNLVDVQINMPQYSYTGKEIVPTIEEVEVLVDGRILSQEEKRGLAIKSVENNINLTDKAVVTLAGSENFTGEKQCVFSINAMSIQDEHLAITIDGQNVQGANTGYKINWDGTAKQPEIAIKNGETELVLGKDYAVTYRYNTEIGTARVIITGKGNYYGSRTLFFEIIGMEFSEESGVQVVVA